MNYLKRTLSFLIAGMLCVSLAACNSTEEETEGNPDVETPKVEDTATDSQPSETDEPETDAPETKPAALELDPLPDEATLAAMSDAEYFADYFRPVIRFAVASDVHVDDSNSTAEDSRLAELYKTAYAYADAHDAYKALDGVFIVGDFSNTGTLSSMQKFADIVDKNDRDYTVTRAVLGNHEFYQNEDPVAGMTETLGYEDDDVHLILEGYHFIMLSPDCEGNGYSEEKQNWLATELKAAAEDDATGTKPIFVFQHHPVQNTVLGSADWGVTDLSEILSAYPQVVDFSGHSHFPMNDPRSIWQGDFTALGTGTLSYYEMDIVGVQSCSVFPTNQKGSWGSSRASRDAAQYYVVEVDANNAVKIQGYDLLSGTFMMDPIYLRSVGDASSFTYTDARADASAAPVFSADAAINLTKVTRAKVEMEFPQATDDDQVQNYRVELYKGDALQKKDYRLACTCYIPAPETLTASFDGLEALTEYTVKIYAVDCWGKESEPIEATFTTPAEAVVAATGDLPQPDVFSIQFQEDGMAIDAVSGTELDYNGTPTAEYNEEFGKYVGIFDGATNYLFIDFLDFYDQLTTSVTLEAYMKLDSASGSYVDPFANFESGGLGMELDTATKTMQWYVNVNGTYHYPGGKIAIGEYFHFAGTYDGEVLKCYINGILVDELEISGEIHMPSSAQYLSIGADSTPDFLGSANMVGSIVTANIYSKPLSDEEIAALYMSYPGSDLEAVYNKMEEDAAAAIRVAAPAYTGELPAPDVLSVEFKEDGSAIDAVSGVTLEAQGAPKTEYSDKYDKYVGVFDGSSDYKFNEFKNFYEKLGKSLTFEVVLKYDQYTGSYVNSVSNMQSGGFGIETTSSGEMQFYVSIDGSYYHPSGMIELGEDIHFVGTYDGQFIRCYINGVLQEENEVVGTITFPSNENAQFMCIGADSNSDGAGEAFHAGTITAANVYSNVFDASMVSALYNQYKLSKADIAAATVPAPDVLSVEFKEDGSAVDVVSGVTLEAQGTPTVAKDETTGKYVGVFDGSSDYKFNEFKNFYEKLGQSVTFEVVLKYDDYGSLGYVNSVSNMQSGGFGIETTGDGEMQFYISIDGAYHHPSGMIELGKDIHFVGTYDGKTIKCYINGNLIEAEDCEGSITFPSNESAQFMCIGADSANGGTGEAYHTGTIAVTNVYSTVLDDVQIAKLYQNYAG